MVRLYALLFVVEIALAICALISCLSTEEGEIRALPRIVWVLIILFFPLLGSIAWFATGRPATPGAARPHWRPGSGFPEAERPRQVAPDDNPEFLRSLGGQSKSDQEMFARWEADLRRREEDIRRREAGDPSDGDNRPEV